MFHLDLQDIQDFGPCDCCDSMSRLAAGLVYKNNDAYAGYQVHWTLGQIERHGATFYVILGQWGEGTTAEDRYAVALLYRADSEATGFMVIDADDTQIASNPLVGKALRREDVVGTPLAKEIFDLVDFIWLHDDRISEITGAGKA